jgi:alginate O-acetyltransferase complex protein AlgI
MIFVEPFLLFIVLPVAVLAFYAASRIAGRNFYAASRIAGRNAALAVLVLVSAVFYAPYGAKPAAILVVSLLVNLVVGSRLCRADDTRHRYRSFLLAFGLLFNFGALAAFKYLDAILVLFRSPGEITAAALAIPAGISFYTFHQAVFLLDAYNRKPDVVTFLGGVTSLAGKVTAFIKYSAFVAFFPQLVIGPITYLSEFAPQVTRQDFGRLRIVDMQVGATLIVIGLFKKLGIADPLADGVNPVYAALVAGQPISSAQAFFALSGFYFQLYFDFSGYADMALGIARLFGIRLPVNFDSPLRATGIVDFYRRWHITLTRVIALFLFTPLSLWGSRLAIQRGYTGWRRRALSSWMPFLVNFQMIALWHAAKLTFVLFGVVHGVWYVVETEVRATKWFKSYRKRTSDNSRMIAGMAITVLPMMITFAMFRSEDLSVFSNLLAGLSNVTLSGAETAMIRTRNWGMLAFAAAIAYLMPNIYDLLRRYRPGIVTFVNQSTLPDFVRVRWRPNLFWAVFVTVLASIVFTKLNKPTPFLYAGF